MPEMKSKAVIVSDTEKWLLNPKFRNALAEACPRDFKAVALARAALTMVRDDANLRKCSQQSILNSVLLCAQTGLMPGQMGLAAIVPYKTTAQFQVMYKGLLQLAYRSGRIAGIQAEVVYEGDMFEWDEGSSPFVKFRRSLDRDRKDAPRMAAFCSIVPVEGPSMVRVMSWAEILDIEDRYAKGTRDERPWMTERDEMACKTVIKRAAKRAPISLEMSSAIAMDDIAETGKIQQPVGGPVVEDLMEQPAGGAFCNRPLTDDPDSQIVCAKAALHQGECHP